VFNYGRSLEWAHWCRPLLYLPSGTAPLSKKGRDFAAWLGLVPRQWSTGGKAKLLGISKRGNPYLRKMFIQGARAAVLRVKREGSSLGKWMSGLETRAARDVVIVATANKLARISWAVLASGNDYHPTRKVLVISN
jgi:transposase